MSVCAVSWAIVRLALGDVESGNDDCAHGRAGEISRYQIKRSVWRSHYHAGRQNPWRNEAVAWSVAFEARELYALWNAPGTFRQCGYRVDRLPKVIGARCNRFARLCQKYAKKYAKDGK